MMMEPAPRLHRPAPRSSHVLIEILINESKMTLPRSQPARSKCSGATRGCGRPVGTKVAHGLGESDPCRASLVAQSAVNPPAMWETQAQSQGRAKGLASRPGAWWAPYGKGVAETGAQRGGPPRAGHGLQSLTAHCGLLPTGCGCSTRRARWEEPLLLGVKGRLPRPCRR